MTLKTLQVVILALLFAAVYFAEQVQPSIRANRGWRFAARNVGIGLINVLLTLPLASGFVWLLAWIGSHRLGLLQRVPLPMVVQVAFTIIAMDLWMYAWHRLNHEWRPLWHFHRFHHRDEHMNASTALRFHIAELWLSYPGKLLVCLLLGIGYTPLLLYELLFFASIVLHHSNIRIGKTADARYRILFASPAHHRLHHSDRAEDTHANYGALFSIWDRCFCTFVKERPYEIRFGLPPEGVEHDR